MCGRGPEVLCRVVRARSIVIEMGSEWCQYGRMGRANVVPGRVKRVLMGLCEGSLVIRWMNARGERCGTRHRTETLPSKRRAGLDLDHEQSRVCIINKRPSPCAKLCHIDRYMTIQYFQELGQIYRKADKCLAFLEYISSLEVTMPFCSCLCDILLHTGRR